MTIENINVEETLNKAKKLLKEEKELSPALRSTFEVILILVTLLLNRLNLNSTNSSKPPSSDPNRKKKSQKKGERKRGGQKGHSGTNLKKVESPDEIKKIKIDRRTLPRGKYTVVGYESRQVFDIQISRIVTEYQAEILEDQNGKRYTASFPEKVTRPVQYGNFVKAHSVYMSQYQLIPYNRIQDYFFDQMGIPISAGSLYNFNQEIFDLLEDFDKITRQKLIESLVLHADETGINVDGTRIWLHSTSSELWTHYYPHIKRGSEAMDEIGILPQFNGTLCHDHWKPYYKYHCIHSLCNAHHLRELECAWEQDGQTWAKKMKDLLINIKDSVEESNDSLKPEVIMKYIKHYRKILKSGDEESPPPQKSEQKNKRGRLKKSKSRNLLERLRDYEDDVLRFMTDALVPFTNNLGETDLRMTKVQQKISGCFRSIEGAYIFCRIRGYLSTCRKHNIGATEALSILLDGELPDFTK